MSIRCTIFFPVVKTPGGHPNFLDITFSFFFSKLTTRHFSNYYISLCHYKKKNSFFLKKIMKSILFYLRVTNQLSPHPSPIINVFYFQSHLHYYFDISFEKHAISQVFVSKSCVSETGIRFLV